MIIKVDNHLYAQKLNRLREQWFRFSTINPEIFPLQKPGGKRGKNKVETILITITFVLVGWPSVQNLNSRRLQRWKHRHR